MRSELARRARTGGFFDVASPDDLEDVVALYLQDKGYRIFPSTSKTSMANYEYILAAPSGGRAAVQVKSGNVAWLDAAIPDGIEEYFVFMAHPTATIMSSDPRIRRIAPSELEQFARASWIHLPRRLQRLWPV